MYMVDHYSVLSVAADASTQQITEAHETLHFEAAQQLANLREGAPERAAIEQRLKLLDAALSILADQSARADHDQAMETWSGPVSHDGIPLVVIAPGGSARYMLMDDEDYEAQLAEHIQRADELSGHDPSLYALVQEAIDEGVDTPRARRTWLQVLRRAYQQLAFREALFWDRIGARDLCQDDTCEGYADLVAQRLLAAKCRQQEELDEVLPQLANQGLLPVIAATPQETIELARQVAQQRLDRACAQIMQLATAREDLAAERLQALQAQVITDEAHRHSVLIVEVMFEAVSAPPQAFSLLDNVVEQVQGAELGLPYGMLLHHLDLSDNDVVGTCDEHGISVIRYRHEEGVDLREELEQILTLYYAPLMD